ncbi:MAG TPA: sugar ABC transporter permease [Solirubrobacteraceae bacterium]|nr:sugar ABC transporter permease [Solirubrobacteraceae bacterium]
MSAEQLLAVPSPLPAKGLARAPRGPLRRADLKWGLAFIAPYAAVFLAFVLYPFGYALWLASEPALYAELIDDPLYLPTLVNTLVFVGIGVNVKMFLALLLSGFFLRRGWWIRVLLAIYLLPWLIAAAQVGISFHWMLIGELGLIDRLLEVLFGIEGPLWLNDRSLAVAANTAAYVWKWMPFWTVIFLAARMTIPRDIYDAARVDGATGVRSFVHVTLPLMANLYLVCTLLSTLWTLGDFTTVYLVSSGAPAGHSHVLATLGYRYAFDTGRPALGVAAVMSVLPVLIPMAIVLMRRFHVSEVRL